MRKYYFDENEMNPELFKPWLWDVERTIWLESEYHEKDIVNYSGGRWDPNAKKWFTTTYNRNWEKLKAFMSKKDIKICKERNRQIELIRQYEEQWLNYR